MRLRKGLGDKAKILMRCGSNHGREASGRDLGVITSLVERFLHPVPVCEHGKGRGMWKNIAIIRQVSIVRGLYFNRRAKKPYELNPIRFFFLFFLPLVKIFVLELEVNGMGLCLTLLARIAEE